MEKLYNENGNPCGHVCKCGKAYKWSAYVFAHWNILLNHKCDDCGNEIKLLAGNIL